MISSSMSTLSELLPTLTTLRDNLGQEERITKRLGITARGPLGLYTDRFRKRKELVQQAIDQLNILNDQLTNSNVSVLLSQISSLQQQLAACQAQNEDYGSVTEVASFSSDYGNLTL